MLIGYPSFSYGWQEKPKTSLSLNNSLPLTAAVLHKPGRHLELVEAFPQSTLFCNQSQSWGLTQFSHLIGGSWKSPYLIISLTQAFVSVDEPKAP